MMDKKGKKALYAEKRAGARRPRQPDIDSLEIQLLKECEGKSIPVRPFAYNLVEVCVALRAEISQHIVV